jgi:hypothetical protein
MLEDACNHEVSVLPRRERDSDQHEERDPAQHTDRRVGLRRERKRNAHREQKHRKDHVGHGQAIPCCVAQLTRRDPQYIDAVHDDHQGDSQAAERIQRQQAFSHDLKVFVSGMVSRPPVRRAKFPRSSNRPMGGMANPGPDWQE